LDAVLETGSFSRAASDLCITQSAVSQRIRFLEERYGFTLIDRTGASICATDAGKIVLAKAKRILALEKEMEHDLKGLEGKSRLSLCCTPTFAVVYLPKVLNRFLLSHSDDVDLKFALNTPEQSLKGLFAKDYDMSVVEHCGTLAAGDALTYPLPPDELAFVSAPSLEIPVKLTIDALLEHRLIARREGCSSRKLLKENLARFDKTLDDFKATIIHDDLHLTIQTAIAGRGVAFVSRSLVQEVIRRGDLHEHQVEGFQCRRSRTALVDPGRSDDPVIADLLESVRAAFEQVSEVGQAEFTQCSCP
jgi:DNA-binding transcriptional LysR family regulator